MADLIEHLEEAHTLARVLGIDERPLYEMSKEFNKKALWHLARNGGLVGTEVCNERAEVKGRVADVDCESDIFPAPLVIYRLPSPNSEHSPNCVYIDEVTEQFFRMPGSSACGGDATVELLRQPPDAPPSHRLGPKA